MAISFGKKRNVVCEAGKSRPATINETRYVMAELAETGSYMIAMGHRVEGRPDVDLLQKSFETVVRRHEALRTSFALNGRRVEARISETPRFVFAHMQSDDMSPAAFRDLVLPLVFDDVRPDVPGSLVRLFVVEAAECWRFTVAMHHAVSDGFSRGVVNRELLKLYAGETLADVNSYADYAGNAPRISDAETEAAVARFPQPAQMPPDGAARAGAGTRGQFIERGLPGAGPALRRVSKSCGAGKFATLAALYALGLKAFTGESQVATFFQSEGRRSLGAPNSVVGPFSNTLPLDLQFDPGMPFDRLAREIKGRVSAVLALENTDVAERVHEAGRAPAVSLNMFPPAPVIRAGDLKTGPREFLDRRTEHDLNLVWSEDSGVIRARAFYEAAHLSEERAAAFLSLQIRLLNMVLETPGIGCDLLLARAYAKAPAKIAPSRTDPPPGRLHDAFFDQAQKTPDAPAVIAPQEQWSYDALRAEAAAYSRALLLADAGPRETIAVLADRQPALVAALLGISAYGAPFVVIDAGLPRERIRAILQRADAKRAFALTTPAAVASGGSVTLLRPARYGPDIPPARHQPGRAVAWHLFTSGTTGEPKRVSHPDATLIRFLRWQAEMLGGGSFRTMLMAGLTHDPVMRDIFLPLSTGGAVVIPREEDIRDPAALRELIDHNRPDTLHLTPATGHLISIGAGNDAAFSSVRHLFWGGDRLDATKVSRWRQFAPGARQFNLYGTTETPQAALICEISGAETRLKMPLGEPVPWAGVRIERDGVQAGFGVLGEIVIDLGDPVRGARGGPDTATGAPSMVHHTGDFGFMLPGSGVHFAGRKDDQIKVNALRIELSDISHHAEDVPGVRQAVTLQTGADGRELSLFIVSENLRGPAEIRAALSQMLPDYMVPQHIVVVDHIPLSPNGKTDAKALRAMTAEVPENHRPSQPVQTAAERQIADVLARSTGLPADDRHLSLADLGADSLARIEARLGLEALGVDLAQGWEFTSITDLAKKGFSSASGRPSRRGAFAPQRMESFLVMRSLAIIAIVAHHSGLYFSNGFSAALIALTGFSFAKLQLPAILGDDRTGRVWATIARLMVPLVPVSLVIYGVHIAIGNDPHISALLFYENMSAFVDSVLLQRSDSRHHISWLWFLHVYLQIFIVIGLLLASGRVRRALRSAQWRTVMGFFVLAEAAGFSTVLIAGLLYGDIGHVAATLHRSAGMLMPVLVVGGLAALATTRRELLVSLLAGLGHILLFNLVIPGGDTGIWLFAVTLATLAPYIPLPAFLSVVVLAVSGEALMIYLTHRASLFALTTGLGFEPPALIQVIFALVTGVLLGKAVRPLLDRLGVGRLAERRVNFS
ncbi:AMP-binding protein [Roseobacter ponti]|uniref:AMP-binding protein n=1 Tax=Roseobacter ponti TaxID=1891787 RepID=A0A858SV27_9RHOB|nr:AMP-binding protein [Roseobacter ponti]QJF50746.1 AMP-binding protein [Roseobacter ponti]